MKNINILLLLVAALLFNGVAAQSGYERVTISEFDRPMDKPLIDTLDYFLGKAKFNDFISDEVVVYSKKDLKKNFGEMKKVLNQLQRNGSDDISKCFFPRHSINFYKDGTVQHYILICFECNGIRFSDERRLTGVKSVEKREALMKKLKEAFESNNLSID